MNTLMGWLMFLIPAFALALFFALVNLKDQYHTPRRTNRLKEPHHGYWGLIIASVGLGLYWFLPEDTHRGWLWLSLIVGILGLLMTADDLYVHLHQLSRQWTGRHVKPDWEYGGLHAAWYKRMGKIG